MCFDKEKDWKVFTDLSYEGLVERWEKLGYRGWVGGDKMEVIFLDSFFGKCGYDEGEREDRIGVDGSCGVKVIF